MISIKLTITLFLFSLLTQAQISGNQIYGNSNHNYATSQNQSVHNRKVITTESTLQINVRLLLNKTADSYLITIGTNQEGKTILECNKAINKRIKKLRMDMERFGLKANDIYVDFISQTKIYDYEVGTSQAEQLFTGYEIKKNIILKIKEIQYIDELIEMASEQAIFDIIKVEYIDSDVNATYSDLYKEAMQIAKSRLKLYTEISDLKVKGKAHNFSDNFYAISPKTQYKKYQAFESSAVNIYHDNRYPKNFVQKESRKQTTFYYDGLPTGNFDKIINAAAPIAGLQYVFELTAIYDLEK